MKCLKSKRDRAKWKKENTHQNVLSKPCWCSFPNSFYFIEWYAVAFCARSVYARACVCVFICSAQVKSWQCVLQDKSQYTTTYRRHKNLYSCQPTPISFGLKVEICRRFNVMIIIASWFFFFSFLCVCVSPRTELEFIHFWKTCSIKSILFLYLTVGFDTGK